MTMQKQSAGQLPAGDGDDRMNRNASSLVASSVITSVLGFGFWILAANTMSTADVGTGSAAVAALVLLGNTATLGLRNALPRFIPAAGANTSQLIARSYAAAAIAGLLVAGVFVAGAGFWASELTMLTSGAAGRVLFPVAVAVWAVFILQDSVLIGLRHATWVPVENLGYAALKLGMLAVLASVGSWSLVIAWAVPALVIIGPLNYGIFTRLVPKADQPGRASPIEWRSLVRFASGDHSADIVRYLGAEGVVLVVLARLGPESSAPLFFAITIAASLQLVSSNIVSAYVAEASARPGEADALLRRSAKHISRLVVPGALVAALGAPLGLALFGSEYVDAGTNVLRLLLLATIPQIVTTLAIGRARFERRVADVVKIAIASAIAPLIGGAFLVGRFGIEAVGWSVLVGQSVLALVLVLTTLRSSLLSTSWARRAIDRAVGVRRRVRQQRRIRAAATLFDELDATRGDRPVLLPRTVLGTEGDTIVARVDHPEQPLIVKAALSPAATSGLFRHALSVGELHRAAHGSAAANLLPRIVEQDSCLGHSYVIETACQGVTPMLVDRATRTALATGIGALHAETCRPVRPEDDIEHTHVTVPTAVLLADPRLADRGEQIRRIETKLVRALRDREPLVARIHGDYWYGNVMIDPQGGYPTVTGIIDWENSVEAGIPEVDLAHLWLSSEPGTMAESVLRATLQERFIDAVDGCGTGSVNTDLPAGLVVALAWLSHVAGGLNRSTRYPLGRVWLRAAVLDVLDVLDALADGQLDRVVQ